MNPFSIAALNSMYRFAAMLLLLPFVKGIERLTKVLIPNREDDEEDSDTLDLLEDRFLNYPDLALAQCQRAMDSMAENVVKNLARAMDLLDILMKGNSARSRKRKAALTSTRTSWIPI